MAKKANENKNGSRSTSQSVTIGGAQVRLIRIPGSRSRQAVPTESAEVTPTVMVPAGSYEPEHFPELEQLKRDVIMARPVDGR
jgi:hypothetical protein